MHFEEFGNFVLLTKSDAIREDKYSIADQLAVNTILCSLLYFIINYITR